VRAPASGTVVLGQRFTIALPVGNEEGTLTIVDLFDLADEDVNPLSSMFADLRSQTQLSVRLQRCAYRSAPLMLWSYTWGSVAPGKLR
jgi:hypothetical protein